MKNSKERSSYGSNTTDDSQGFLSFKFRKKKRYLGLIAALILVACGKTTEPSSAASQQQSNKEGANTEGSDPTLLDVELKLYQPLNLGQSVPDTAIFNTGDSDEEAIALCVGERHPYLSDHRAQLRLLEALIAQRRLTKKDSKPEETPPLIIAWEMFSSDKQEMLSQFRQDGQLETLKEQSRFEQDWGFDFALYSPLLKAGYDAKAQFIAANLPRAEVRKIAKEGRPALDSMNIADLGQWQFDNRRHRQFFSEAMKAHPMPADSFDNYYLAQIAWDETMASHAASALKDNQKADIIVFAGNGHCHRSAIPTRFEKRSGRKMLSILTADNPETLDGESLGDSDYLLLQETK